MKKVRFVLTLIALAVSACNAPLTAPPPTETAVVLAATSAPLPSATATFTSVPTSAPTATQTSAPTATQTSAPTNTAEPTATSAPEFSFPAVTVNKQAHCRYGPAVAYLHAADLFVGDTGTVRNRALYSNWLYVKFDKLNYFCWVAPSVVDVVGDVGALNRIEPNLQSVGSNMYGPPKNVRAYRNGDQVVVSWDQMQMTEDKDRGYLIEAFVCQGGAYIWWTFSYPDQFTTTYSVKDEAGCASPSYGRIYTVEKHGFSQPAEIPWPPP
ncbi:MAG: hypothetical protein LC099_01780 [Anaerolineales bacterium]|nr:hypothetical protein [Anaerolineales bacterium]